MKPNARFAGQSKSFWACVRSLSQELGYTVKGQGRIKVHTINEIRQSFINLDLNPLAIFDGNGAPGLFNAAEWAALSLPFRQ